MGCDGGTIPRRDELVRMKKKPEQKDKEAERSFLWRNCALSQQKLQEPIVACALGRLYSKSSVLEALLDKDSKPDCISHIKNLKDIIDLKLIKNPAYKDTEHAGGAVGDGGAPYICPISGIEMTGKFRFVFLWGCGCVLAERALKEVKQSICHMCQQPFTTDDIVVLNGTDEDIEMLQIKMAERIANRKTTKKSKSDKKAAAEIKTEPPTLAETSTTTATEVKEIKKEVESKVKVEQEAGASGSNANKKELETIPLALPKFNPNKVMRGHFGSTKRALSNNLVQDSSYKKTKKEYSVAEDPQTSEVYKSLFTSHKDERDQKRAHWVTYNPFYN